MIDPNSPTWLWLEAHLKKVRDDTREKNDSQHHQQDMTSFLRGRISLCKELLDLPKTLTRQRQSTLVPTTGDEE